MTEPSDRAQRALRRASIRENSSSGYCCDDDNKAQQMQQQAKIRNNDPTCKNNENPPSSKAVAHSRFIAPPPPSLATTTTITSSSNTTATSTVALPSTDDSSKDHRKRPSSSSLAAASTAATYSVATNTRSKKHRSGPPPPPPPGVAQAPSHGDDLDHDDEEDDAASAEAVLAYRLKSAAAAAATVTPAVPRRQILFEKEETTKQKEQQQQSDDDSSAAATAANNTNAAETTTPLPDGVVDIYPPRASLSSKKQSSSCKCVAEISLEQRAGFLHTAHYGAEWQAYLRDKEKREYPMVGFTAAASSPCFSTTESSSSMQQDDSSPDSTASKSSSSSSLSSSSSSTTSSPSTPEPTTGSCSLLRFDVRASKDAPRFLEEETNTGSLQRQPYIDARMRAVLVSWLVEVGTEYDISDQAFHLAITLLDLMLAKGPTDIKAWQESCRRRRCRRLRSSSSTYEDNDDDVDSENGTISGGDSTTAAEPDYFVVQRGAFQALGCACAWIASKMEDRNPPLQDDFVYISDQSVSSGMLRCFEHRICKELNFNLHRLTPIHYANSFLRASNACPCLTCPFDHPVLRQLFLYLLELARIPIALVDCPPSLVAAAAVYLGRATLGLREEDPNRQATTNNNNNNNNGYWTKTLQYYTGYSIEDLKDTVLRIYEYQLQAEQLAVAPYIKYRSRTRLQVSLKTVLRIEDLGFFSNTTTMMGTGGLNHDNLPLVTA